MKTTSASKSYRGLTASVLAGITIAVTAIVFTMPRDSRADDTPFETPRSVSTDDVMWSTLEQELDPMGTRSGLCLLDYEDMDFRVCARMSKGLCKNWSDRCTPADRCAWDPKKERFSKCRGKNASCVGFTGKCKPQDKCMFNAAENMYQTCRKFSKDKCLEFKNKKCAPSKQTLS